MGTEGGFLPLPAIIPATPVGYEYNRRNIVVLNVSTHALFLGPAERADIIVDFSQVPASADVTNIILYNDAPAPVPAFDGRNDYYTGDPDQSVTGDPATGGGTGGAPSTLPGYGPNTRTIMEFRVVAGVPAATAFDLPSLQTILPAAFAASQDAPIIPQTTYPAPYTAATDTYSRIEDTSLSFTAPGPQPVRSITLKSGGAGYSSAPTVGFTAAGGSGAAATATITAVVNAIQVTNPGSGYITTPLVSIAGGGGTGATATAVISGVVNGVTINSGGTNYTSAPAVAFVGGGAATAATGVASLIGPVGSIAVNSPGSGYTSAPTVRFTGGGGTGATATAVISGSVASVNVTGAGRNYTGAPTVGFTGGGGSGAAATAVISGGRVTAINVTAGGTGYTSSPQVSLTGGGGSGASGSAAINRGVTSITVARGGSGYTSAPAISFTGGNGSGAAATAVIVGSVNAVQVTSGGAGYSSAPSVQFTGGNGSGAAATAAISPSGVSSIAITNPGSGFTSAPLVAISGGGGTGATASATILGIVKSLTLTAGGSGYTANPAVTFTGGGATTPATATATVSQVMEMQPKTIQELFELNYGRMNATLGVELPFTNFNTQTTIPLGYRDPTTELLKDGETQIWKITHNGVDTHAIHFHLFNVQLINRVGWDGMITPPEPNELGWKETVRMNPLQDAIVAMRANKPDLPWQIPDSWRSPDTTMPAGATISVTDPVTGNAMDISNAPVSFGWEYVWHCHLLGHEENDMMRAMSLQVNPTPPVLLGALGAPAQVDLSWTGTGSNVTSFQVRRAPVVNGTVGTYSTISSPGAGVTSYADNSVTLGNIYSYEVIAVNGLPTSHGWYQSAPSNAVRLLVAVPAAPTNLAAVASALSTNLPTVTLTWIDNSVNLTGFTIQRSTNANFTANLATFAVAANITTFLDNTIAVTPTKYFYRVCAFNVLGNSGWATTNVTTSGQLPAAPTNLTVNPASVTRTSVTLNWVFSAVGGAAPTGFVIQRATDAAFTTGLVTATVNTPTLTSYVRSGLSRRTTYYFRVAATNASGNSALSNVVTATTLP